LQFALWDGAEIDVHAATIATTRAGE